MVNSFVGIGRLTKDPDIRMLPGTDTQVSTFTIAIDRKYKSKNGEKKTDFLMCETFGKTAEFVSNYLVKGRLVSVEGEVHIDRYEKDGEKKSITKISVSSVSALDKRGDSAAGDSGESPDPPGFKAVDDDDIPF